MTQETSSTNDPIYTFAAENAQKLKDKGTLVIGALCGELPHLGDRVLFEGPDGREREARVLGVARRVFDKDGKPAEGKLGVVLDEIDRAELRTPVELRGFAGSERGALGAEGETLDDETLQPLAMNVEAGETRADFGVTPGVAQDSDFA